MIRYVHKRRFPLGREGECQLCGTMHGLRPGQRVCDATRCLMCGTRQCMANGLGKGACGICFVGLLVGWSGDKQKCGIKSCDERAIARASRVGYGCREHVYYEANLLDRRNTQFVAYDDAPFGKFSEVACNTDLFRQVRLFLPAGA